MSVDNKLTSKKNISVVSSFYFLLGLAIAVPIAIILYTEGSLKQELIRYWYLSILLILFPIFLSYIGLYYFVFSEDKYILGIRAKCMALGRFHSHFNQRLELPKDHIINYEIKAKAFGLKKVMSVFFRVNETNKKKKFNVSMLSKKEFEKLIEHMDGIVSANKKAI